MPETTVDQRTAATAAATVEPAPSRGTVGRRIAVGVFVPATLVIYLVTAAPTLTAGVGSLASASLMWLLAGLTATLGSMLAFAALRTRTLAVGGSRVRLRRTLAVSYGAGAVHTTLPAGAVFSTAYAYRHLRAWGASTSATTWSMAITGLLSTLTLSGIGVLGLALTAGTGGSIAIPILEIALGLATAIALVQTAHHPAHIVRWAHRGLVGINRLRRKPVQTGAARLSEIVADLRVIRPSARDWLAAAMLALANWAMDLACLAACCAAVGIHITFPALLLTYTAGMAAGSLLPLPAGLGAVETAMTLGITMAGAAAAPALAAVLLYRLLSTGSVVVLGWLIVAAQQVHTGPDDSAHRTT
ncbi:hypothetical protein SAMN04515671_3512 [Nakamurella panacisegetis]|uniref:Lysylphosphatidylglycerol synthase TM region n=1 Tax=Nakamurella panacisegetis TaxID=1090615 RepID=A0A1H0RE80_9ACTN|nr:YbhN family protein [Nakamurella panacisegetis]SDP27489.1 hypothetical protein SAMN04515671_3512 [Nakamurella panacisegetis]